MADTKEKDITPEKTQEPSLAEILAEMKAMREELQDAQAELEKAREEKEELQNQVKEFIASDAAKKAGQKHAELRESATMERGDKKKQYKVKVAFTGMGKDRKVFTETIVIPHFADINWMPYWIKKIYRTYEIYHDKDFGLVTSRKIQGRPKVEDVEKETLDFIGKKIGDLDLWQICKACIYYGLVRTQIAPDDEWGSQRSFWYAYKSYVLNEQDVDEADYDENLVLKA